MTAGNRIEQAYSEAQEQYGEYGIDTDQALAALSKIPLSIHCWQGDDVVGFEGDSSLEGAGIQATGNYPGRARTPDELRADFEKAHSLIPGMHRISLHAIYAETNGKQVGRDELAPEHFRTWIDWAKELGIGMDFNPTFFAHPKARDGFTLASYNENIRKYWVNHGIACRRIGNHIGEELGTACVNNVWIPDGLKDIPADRKTPRVTLKKSLDEMFAPEFDANNLLDSVESKLFGIGSESYVVGSHDFYVGYAIKNNKLYCVDTGHFHPTENVADKITSLFTYVDELMFHISRGVRWDSDHVVLFNDDVRELAGELVRGDYLSRAHIGLDFFDASINRVAAWVIGTRATLKALLNALLEPGDMLQEFEANGDYTSRLAIMEEAKTLPFGAVWDYYCLQNEVPVGKAWFDEVKHYEVEVLLKR